MSTSREEVDEAADAALIDRLYGGEDVDELGSVRSLIARVRDEAPVVDAPQAISARLLLAAAEHAPRKAAAAAPPVAGGSLWARIKGWFTPMIAHPGLAGALTLLLVAGVGGALYMRGKGGTAEPTIDETGPAPTRSAPEAEPEHAGAPSASTEPMAPGGGGGVASGSAATEDLQGQDESKQEATGAVRDRTTAANSAIAFPDDKPAPKKKQGKAQREPTGDKNFEDGMIGGAATGGEGDSVTESPPPPPPPARKSEEKVSPEQGVPPVVVTKQPVQDRRPAEDPAPAPETTNDKAPTKAKKQRVDTSDNDKARELTAKAIELAKAGKCADMEKLAAQVRALDRTYYDDAFARQADIKKCRTAK